MIYLLDDYKILKGNIIQDDIEHSILNDTHYFLSNKKVIIETDFVSEILNPITQTEKDNLILESDVQEVEKKTTYERIEELESLVEDLTLEILQLKGVI